MQTPPSPRSDIGSNIGVFDSGVGGFTVLRELHALLPNAPMRYFADTAYAPYGGRNPEDIRARCFAITEHLIEHGAGLIVVACNTATAHAIEALRARWPELHFVGTEPGIKPAVAATRNGRIGLLATPATAASPRLRALVERHIGDRQLIVQGCPGIVDRIEAGDLSSAALRDLVDRYSEPLRAAGIDTALLGCTHYPLIEPLWRAALGSEVTLLRIETAVARRAASMWMPRTCETRGLEIETSGDAVALREWIRSALGWTTPHVQAWQPESRNGQQTLTV
ncbi:MAG: glutamate racemase [Rubrivivax sp.]|nr:MAG: glutamate racemase [Rubrivivax sp.]